MSLSEIKAIHDIYSTSNDSEAKAYGLPADQFFKLYYIPDEETNIGEGTHSVVKECICKQTGKKLAVKMVRSDDEQLLIYTEKEYKILELLNGHDNIV
mmetsp:Transcript_11866/g.8647  ORF Transcript_11866/g.8647 Transcript_11866/m.8647 type:complete len:98 (-) Transcript_11866:657-950(-)